MVFFTQRPQNQINRMYQQPNNRFLPNMGVNRAANTNNIQHMIQRFANPQAVGSLATKSVGNLSKTLNNVQQVLKVVQSATPIVQEYGPMVKNLPAMYRMMKAITEVDKDDKVAETKNDERSSPRKGVSTSEIKNHQKSKDYGHSTPKLYI